MTESGEKPSNSDLLTIALVSETLILAIAFLGARFTGLPIGQQVYWRTYDLILGVLATIPMLLLLVACYVSKASGLQQIRRFVRDLMGPLLHEGGWPVMIVLALLAGVCEESFFRGFLYPWFRTFNPFLAMLLTNVAFALLHAVTPLYAWVAGMLGLYLTATLSLTHESNLLVPIVVHSLYDLVAFVVVRHDYRSQPTESQCTDTTTSQDD